MDNNMQYTVNKIAFELVNEAILSKSDIDKMLGVLVNDGLYAMWLYACDKMKLDMEKIKKAPHDKKIEELEKQDIIRFFEKICQLAKYIEKGNIYENTMNTLKGKLGSMNDNKKIIENKIYIYNELAAYFRDLSKDLDKLLFMRDLLEKILVYARYHAKAVGD